MEKLIYLLGRKPGADMTAYRERLLADVVPAALKAGAHNVVVTVADIDDEVRAAAPTRIAGPWEHLGGALYVWFDSHEARAELEPILASCVSGFDGYLVTESMPQRCDITWAQGERRPGVTQFTAHAKPADVSEADFYYNWQVKHSNLSVALHPLRWSYERNAVARVMTPDAPGHRAIVLEHFRELRDFTDESRYFGDPAVVEHMFEELPGFCDFASMVTGPMSEYWFRA